MSDKKIDQYLDIISNLLSEGECCLFIGAGLPRAEAGLPGFSDLAIKVIRRLHKNHPELDWLPSLIDQPSAPIEMEAWANIEERLEKLIGDLSQEAIEIIKEEVDKSSDREEQLPRDISPAQIAELGQLYDEPLLNKVVSNELFMAKPEGKAYQGIKEIVNSQKYGVDVVYTTNYDNSLEDYLGRTRAVRIASGSALDAYRDLHALKIIHLHGHVDQNNYVISESDMFRVALYGNELYEAVKSDFVNKSFIFIGYGLRDPSILFVYSLINEIHGPKRPAHYAVYPSKYLDPNQKKASAKWELLSEIWEDRGVVYIDIDPGEFFSRLSLRLAHIKRQERIEKLAEKSPNFSVHDIEIVLNNIEEGFGFPSTENSIHLLELLI